MAKKEFASLYCPLAAIAICAGSQAIAQDTTCVGSAPDWSLSISDTGATFAYQRTSDMQVMQDDVDLNDNDVRALTLVGPRDSAIVILDQEAGKVTILTQRGQTPVILTGRCE